MASKVARTTLNGLRLPTILVSTSATPADSMTARTPPPAMTPVPGDAGRSRTLVAPHCPHTRWGTVPPTMGTFTISLRACSLAFWIAGGTSRALPVPKPTLPAPSPATTTAEKEKFLPPFTTLATRLM